MTPTIKYEDVDCSKTFPAIGKLQTLIVNEMTKKIYDAVESELRKHGIDENYVGNDLHVIRCPDRFEFMSYEEYYRGDEFLFGMFSGAGNACIYHTPKIPKEWRHGDPSVR
jgi:hypothetical protein